ncbi:MAG TPA: acylneuraminate cytidylyltransferase [Desulfobacterales bacterium]|nr:acylneuraminate cytidylyltransferase [Desulfobacterales bacterium]
MNAAIIPARGGSKGISGKNVMLIAGKPLIAWSVEQALNAACVDKVYVTTDGADIAAAARKAGAEVIDRPAELATDTASSEAALLHALETIEKKSGPVEKVVFLQPTSPVRESSDIEKAVALLAEKKADSLFSCRRLEDYFIWEEEGGAYKSVTYDYKSRKPRQQIKPQYLENGSLYVFKSEVLKKERNRLGGKIAAYEMPFWKSFQIDRPEDIEICEFYLRARVLGEKILK